jgi:hypothetical protein
MGAHSHAPSSYPRKTLSDLHISAIRARLPIRGKVRELDFVHLPGMFDLVVAIIVIWSYHCQQGAASPRTRRALFLSIYRYFDPVALELSSRVLQRQVRERARINSKRIVKAETDADLERTIQVQFHRRSELMHRFALHADE